MVNGCSEAIHCSVADAYRSLALAVFGESVLFIGTQFSILYTFMYSPA